MDVVVRECATILQLFAREDKTLLIRWDSLFVLDLGLSELFYPVMISLSFYHQANFG